MAASFFSFLFPSSATVCLPSINQLVSWHCPGWRELEERKETDRRQLSPINFNLPHWRLLLELVVVLGGCCCCDHFGHLNTQTHFLRWRCSCRGVLCRGNDQLKSINASECCVSGRSVHYFFVLFLVTSAWANQAVCLSLLILSSHMLNHWECECAWCIGEKDESQKPSI